MTWVAAGWAQAPQANNCPSQRPCVIILPDEQTHPMPCPPCECSPPAIIGADGAYLDPNLQPANYNPGTDGPLRSLQPLVRIDNPYYPDAYRPGVYENLNPLLPDTGGGPLFDLPLSDDTMLHFDGLIRGYYFNDQRIEWSGLETTFGAEGVVRPWFQTNLNDWIVSAEGEFFLNQRFGSSILSDPIRDTFRSNFDVDIFEIFQLYAQAEWGDFLLRIGKSRTPFGRYYAPLYTNRLIDAPFIRSDIISWTETGIFGGWHPGIFALDVGVINGEENLDTNSSKGVVGRVGFDSAGWALGISGKYHDGVSSEFHKRFNNYYGCDWAIKLAPFILYGEVIYDEHGFRKDFFDEGGDLEKLGVRSGYGREVYNGGLPIDGVGYYVALGFREDPILIDLSYGDFFPEQIGIPIHDDSIDRFVAKVQYTVAGSLQLYVVGLVENERLRYHPLLKNHPYAIFTGMQFEF